MTRARSQSARTRVVRAEKAGAKIEEHHLANGLSVILAARHLDPVVAVMLWYKVGARDEEEREAGVSHFLEHMMFKGSRRFGKGEIDRITTTLGGSNNAFTTADHTAYWFEFASDRWEKALEIEADRMRALLLDPAEFEAEKAVVLEELAMGDDDPWRSLTQQVQLVLFARHPYRRPVIGFPDALRQLDVASMRSYYERHYHPGNAALVVCGDIEPKSALALVRKHFDSIPAGPPKAAAFRPSMSEPKGEQRVQIAWDDRGSRLVIAWPTALVGTTEDYVFDIVSTVLTGGRTSRLHRRLVLEQGLATSISSHNDTRLDAGVFWIFAECAQGVAPQKLEAAIDREVARLTTELVPAKELDRCKRILLSSEAYDNETVSDLAEEIGEFAADAHWKMALEAPERIRQTSAKDVREVCARLLRDERRVVGWCLPKQAAAKKSGGTSKRTETTKSRGESTRKRGQAARKRGGAVTKARRSKGAA